MIKVVFPPGCYGSFLTKCLYSLTNLGYNSNIEFAFDNVGSSHDHWYNTKADEKILWGHLTKSDFKYINQNIVILPNDKKNLEYYANQFVKSEKANPIRFLLTQFDQTELENKFLHDWNYKGTITDTPIWILREFLSYSIQEILKNSYNRFQYSTVQNCYQIETESFYTNLEQVLVEAADALNLQVQVSSDTIKQIQSAFVHTQKFRDCQNCAEKYADAVIQQTDYTIPKMNFVIEAYIQWKLREMNCEPPLDGVVAFPNNAREIHT